MKIVLVTPLLNLGGGQRYVTELANYWSSNGHNVHIIVLRTGKSYYSINNEVDVIELSLLDKGKIKKVISSFKTFYNLRKKIKQIKPDFVLSILSSTNILVILATRNLGVKVFVVDVMSPLRSRSVLEKGCRKLLYKKASGIIALTDMANDMIKKETGHNNIRTIHNPISKIKKYQREKEKIVINVGRLNYAKGQKYFLEACAKIRDPDWKFVILGEGELRNNLEKQIDELDIHKYIVLEGAVKNVSEWLARASIFAFPSVTESFPIALLEGMAAGLPCVSFDCVTGPNEMIEDGENGFLVPLGDVELFTMRIKQLMRNEKLRILFSNNAQLINQ